MKQASWLILIALYFSFISECYSQNIRIFIAPFDLSPSAFDTTLIRNKYQSVGFTNVIIHYGTIDSTLTATNYDVAFVSEFYKYTGTSYTPLFLNSNQANLLKTFIQGGKHVVWSAENWLTDPSNGMPIAQQTNMLNCLNSIWHTNIINSTEYWDNTGIGPNDAPRMHNNNGPGGLSVVPIIISSGSYSIFSNVPTVNSVYSVGPIAFLTSFTHCENTSVMLFPAFPKIGEGTLIASGEVGYNFSTFSTSINYDNEIAILHYKLLTHDTIGINAINSWTGIGEINAIDTVIACDSVFINNRWFYSDTIIEDTILLDCAYPIQRYININHSFFQNSFVTICNSDSIFIGNKWVKTTGIYYDSLKTTTGCDSIISVNLTVNPSLQATVSITANSNPNCIGYSVTFTAIPTNGGTTPTYQWQVNGVNVGTNSSIFTSNTLTNNDIVTVIMNSSLTSCLSNNPAISNSITMIVNSFVTPTISIAANPTAICENTPVTFTATITNGGSQPVYTWFKNSIAVGTNSATYTDNTLTSADIITCQLTSNATCANPLNVTSNPLNVQVNPYPVADAGADATIDKGESITLNGSGGDTYVWTANSIVVGNTANVTVSPAQTTAYVLEVTNTFGCKDLDTVNINVVYPNVSIYLPTAFSPNNDSKNDEYLIKSNQDFKFFDIKIYNRWGELVFSSNNLYDGWDGKFKGDSQPVGVYVVMVKAVPYSAPEQNFIQSVTLIK